MFLKDELFVMRNGYVLSQKYQLHIYIYKSSLLTTD